LIDHIPYNDDIINENAKLELRLFWKDDIDFEVINGDYLGPTYEDVLKLYIDIMK
jgi:hypothetical protein